MKKLILNTLAGAVTASSLLLGGGSAVEASLNVQQLLRCNDTKMEAGFYGQHYGISVHGTDQICAGDPLDRGSVRITGKDGLVTIALKGVHEHNLYEVYWLSIGGDPAADRIHLGSVITDGSGAVRAKVRESLNSPADATSAPLTQMRTAVGDQEAGVFLLYSRGPYVSLTDGDGNPQVYNTSDGTVNGTFNNPILWGGYANFFDGIQFVSGYRLSRRRGPRANGRPNLSPRQPEFDMRRAPQEQNAPRPEDRGAQKEMRTADWKPEFDKKQ